ncbi:Extradiol ring-cleavage dioxygenase [Phytophthora cinnamomi]|uniref:Extradiol ring-cleavage dioxygenase n=1 Tax=Phytophthora cinnamomi TaxID=4785 RepID=UPI0035595C18|nr:Extradiol ring-cleavage dioxygenase [Phytophthora cinnamomi]
MRVLDQSAAVQDSRFTTTIYLEGYQYTRATTSARKTSYRCSYYRSAGCRGKVDLITRSRKFTNFVGHTCERGENYASETPDPITNYTQTDVPAAAAIVTSGHPYMVQAPAPFQPPPINRMSRVGPGQVNPNHLAQIESSPLLFSTHNASGMSPNLVRGAQAFQSWLDETLTSESKLSLDERTKRIMSWAG